MHKSFSFNRQFLGLLSSDVSFLIGIQKDRPFFLSLVIACLFAFSPKLSGQSSPTIPTDKPPSLKILKGIVDKVEMIRGQGPAIFLLREKNENPVQVQLGPIRFLIQKGFNLSVQDEIEVRGLEMVRDEKRILIASEIKNLTQNQYLRLRDEQFRPLWRGGPFGRRRQVPQ